MRRGGGISSLQRYTTTAASFETLSNALSSSQLAALHSQLAHFQTTLRTFATKHATSIRSDPTFRTAFSSMCAEVGVDPLGGGRKGLWDHLGVGEWTYELAVQVVDICLRSRDQNGGLLDLDEVLRGVTRLRVGVVPSTAAEASKSALEGAVTENDIVRAIKALQPLGSGYAIVMVGRRKMVRCVPSELNTDSLRVIDASMVHGYVEESTLCQRYDWTHDRAQDALNKAVLEDGLVWVDEQADGTLSKYYVR